MSRTTLVDETNDLLEQLEILLTDTRDEAENIAFYSGGSPRNQSKEKLAEALLEALSDAEEAIARCS